MTGTVHVVVDVESDGPAPALYSMVSLGAVLCAPPFKTTFGLQTRPISQDYVPEALANPASRARSTNPIPIRRMWFPTSYAGSDLSAGGR
ncbi:MAG: hypothetical protein ACJ8FV_17240 [Xanthobacteraceae bacterium]